MIKAKKTKLLALALAAVCAFGMFALAGCSGGSSDSGSADSSSSESTTEGPSGAISVISREDGSGTRGAFTELFGVVDDNDVDLTTTSAVITNSTAVMMTTVAGDPNAIGYISLGSMDDSVKGVEIDGVAPSAEGVKDGSYKVSRPFNVVTGAEVSDLAQDFLNYIMSSDGQAIIEGEGYVSVSENGAYEPSSDSLSGTVSVAGSSSVTPVMEALADAYMAVNPDVTIEVNQSDSSTGVQNAIEGVCDLGMASRELKDSETSQGVSATVIAQDGIAIIVNNDNPISALTSDQVKEIFLGNVTDWSELA